MNRLTSALAVALLCAPNLLLAQARPGISGEAPEPVKIDRVAVTLKSPEAYQTFLVLKPIKSLKVPAQTDGPISQVLVEKINDQIRAQSEIARIDSEERTLQQKVAEAKLEAAKAGKDAKAIAVAEAELRLAEYYFGLTVVRAPFTGEVAEIHVSAGQFVELGQSLITLIDTTKLTVDVPVERQKVKAGDSLELTVEDRTVNGKVESILPITAEFKNLQELFMGLAVARVVIDNGNQSLVPGQMVVSKLIPRHPVMEVPNSAVQNGDNGTRKVQVIRDSFVKDLPVELYGQVGETHVFVGGRFASTDELIVSASEVIADGSWVRPMLLDGFSDSTPRRPTSSGNSIPSNGTRTSNGKVTRDDF